MRWKPFHTQVLLVLVASTAGFLLAGWGSLINLITFLHSGFLLHNWLLFLIELAALAYLIKLLLLKKDEFTPFLAGLGSFFLLVGSIAGIVIVFIGLAILLFTLYYHRSVNLQAPELPHIRKDRKRI
ncbi:MAG: hypothetical protein AABX70_02250 [Nanoarchaeota archaeon]